MNQLPVNDPMLRSGRESASRPVSAVVFDFMRQVGMDMIFGNPGSTELPMFCDLPDDMSYVLGLQESVVVAMADAYAQSTGKAAFVNLHSAAGLGHAMGAVYTAFRNRSPLVITTGQQSRALLPYDPFLFAESPTEFPKPYVKWACEPASAAAVPAAIARAHQLAMQHPRGPVMVSVPLGDWGEPAEPLPPRQIFSSPGIDVAALDHLSGCLDLSIAPAIVVGPGVDGSDAWDEAVALAERLQARVWVSPVSARCSFPERHPLFAGFLNARQPALSNALRGSDVILVLGAPVFTYHFEGDKAHIPKGAELWLMSDEPGQVAAAATGNAVLGDLKAGIAHLLSRLPARPLNRETPFRRIPRVETVKPISSALVYQTLADIRSPDSIIVEEAPTGRSALHDHLPIERPRGFFATASGGLGYALPASVGVALTRPRAPVIAVIGDGSMMYSIQALWSAAEYHANLLILVLNNGGYGALKGIAAKSQARRVDGVDLGHLDFVALAEAQGLVAMRCNDGLKLEQCLRELLEMRGPRLLEIIIREDG